MRSETYGRYYSPKNYTASLGREDAFREKFAKLRLKYLTLHTPPVGTAGDITELVRATAAEGVLRHWEWISASRLGIVVLRHARVEEKCVSKLL